MDDEKAIQNRLDEAVAQFGRDSEYDGLLTSYVIVMSHATFTDGQDATRYATTYMGGSMPYHTIIGLLEYAKATMLHDAITGSDE